MTTMTSSSVSALVTDPCATDIAVLYGKSCSILPPQAPRSCTTKCHIYLHQKGYCLWPTFKWVSYNKQLQAFNFFDCKCSSTWEEGIQLTGLKKLVQVECCFTTRTSQDKLFDPLVTQSQKFWKLYFDIIVWKLVLKTVTYIYY